MKNKTFFLSFVLSGLIIGGWVIIGNFAHTPSNNAPPSPQSQIEILEQGTLNGSFYSLYRDKKSGFRIFKVGPYGSSVILPPEEEFTPDKMPCEK
jgi:hypothetical protein